MRNFLTIHNHSGMGEIGISRNALAAIARRAAEDVTGTQVVAKDKKGKGIRSLFGRETDSFSIAPDGVRVMFGKDGKALIRMEVSLPRNVEVAKTCLAIQESVANNFALMCDTVPFDVQVRVAHIV